jgi:hypothetical protein
MVVLIGFTQKISINTNVFDQITFWQFRIEYCVREIRNTLSCILSNVTSTKDDRIFDLQRILRNISPESNISTETS